MSTETETHRPLIQAEGISKRFGNVAAVSEVSFEIRRGEVVGFLGPNGAGKTTTMRLLTGFYRPDAGRVWIDGLDTQEHDLRAKRGIGYLPENNPLYAELPVAEHLALTSDLRGIPGSARKTAFERVVAQTGLEPVYYRPVNQLSKGFRQRVGLALAILHEPDVLILDEPTEGLDPNQRVEIRDLIRDLGEAHTVLLSTHVMQEVEQTCERLLVMNHGVLVADAPVKSMLQKRVGAGRQVVAEIEGPDFSSQLGELPSVDSISAEAVDPGRTRYVISVSGEVDPRPLIFSLAAESGRVLWELRVEAPRLEEVFRSLTQDA